MAVPLPTRGALLRRSPSLPCWAAQGRAGAALRGSWGASCPESIVTPDGEPGPTETRVLNPKSAFCVCDFLSSEGGVLCPLQGQDVAAKGKEMERQGREVAEWGGWGQGAARLPIIVICRVPTVLGCPCAPGIMVGLSCNCPGDVSTQFTERQTETPKLSSCLLSFRVPSAGPGGSRQIRPPHTPCPRLGPELHAEWGKDEAPSGQGSCGHGDGGQMQTWEHGRGQGPRVKYLVNE